MTLPVFRDSKVVVDESKPLTFQIVDWYSVDLDDEDDEERNYIIKMFGVTENGHSVSVNVHGFQPFFYITCTAKDELNPYEVQCLKNKISSSFERQLKSEYIDENLYTKMINSFDIMPVHKKSMWGFTNSEKKQYLKFQFDNVTTMHKVKNMLWKDIRVGNFTTSFKFHETNLEPTIRFVHERNIQPGGWVKISDFSQNNDTLESKCQINVSASWKKVNPFENNSIAPFVVLSFDIECTSSHGDFPMAQKTYSKSSNEIFEYYKLICRSVDTRSLLMDAIVSMYTNDHHEHMSKVYTKKPTNAETIRSSVSEHVDDIISILENKIHHLHGENEKPNTRSLLRILDEKLSRFLPKVEGDRVIQIGTTLHRYGETTCFYKNVITL